MAAYPHLPFCPFFLPHPYFFSHTDKQPFLPHIPTTMAFYVGGFGNGSSTGTFVIVFIVGLLIICCVRFLYGSRRKRKMQIVGTPVQPPCIIHLNTVAYDHTNHPAPQYQSYPFVTPGSSSLPPPIVGYPPMHDTTSPPQSYPPPPQSQQQQAVAYPSMPTTTELDQLPPAYGDVPFAPLPISAATTIPPPACSPIPAPVSQPSASSSTFPPTAASTSTSSAPYPDPLSAPFEPAVASPSKGSH